MAISRDTINTFQQIENALKHGLDNINTVKEVK